MGLILSFEAIFDGDKKLFAFLRQIIPNLRNVFFLIILTLFHLFLIRFLVIVLYFEFELFLKYAYLLDFYRFFVKQWVNWPYYWVKYIS